MLAAPQSGERILAWAQQATREINSNIVHNGIGIKVVRTPNGTNISTTGGGLAPSIPKNKMPFDASLEAHEGDSINISLKVLKGELYYGVGSDWKNVPPQNLMGDYWVVDVQVKDNAMVGIVCEYDEESERISPIDFYVDTIPSLGPDTGEAWSDNRGLLYYPLVRFVSASDDYQGPYIFSVTVSEEGEEKTYYAVQSHHGDVFFSLPQGDYFVGEVTSGDHGRYAVVPVDSPQSTSDTIYIDVVELATAATFPRGSRIIAHPIHTLSYATGSVPEEDEGGEG